MAEIAACIRCASTRLDMPQLGDGIIPETDNLGEFVCRQCGFRGIPVLFDSASAHERFVRSHRVDAED